MKANNLTISVPAPRCAKNCPFCVSKMTYGVQDNLPLFKKNLIKARKFADIARVSSILITSKNEPIDNPDLPSIIDTFKEFPIELQTNGDKLLDDKRFIYMDHLHHTYLNTIAISISHPATLDEKKDMIQWLHGFDFTVRLTIVLSDRWRKIELYEILQKCHDLKVSQLTFRIPSIPDQIKPDSESQGNAAWIRQHNKLYDHILFDLRSWKEEHPESLVRTLSFGAEVYDIRGIGTTIMEYCIQENHGEEDIRSLIYQSDGHLYTSWDKKGSILF